MNVLTGPAKQIAVSLMMSLTPALLAHGQTPGAPPLLTLDDAVRVALTQNVDVENARLDVEKARESRNALAATRWPLLKADGQSGLPLNPTHIHIPKGALGTESDLGPLPSEDVDYQAPQRMTTMIQASATQPLTQLYSLSLGLHEAVISEKLAAETLRLKRQQTAQQVRESYYRIAQSQAQIEAAQSTAKALGETKALMERRLNEQAVLQADVLTSAAQLAQQNYQVLQLEDGLDTQKESFNRLLGRDLGESFSVETMDAPAGDELDLEAARAKALKQRPEVGIADLQLEKAKYDVRKQRAAYIPDIGAHVTYLDFVNISFAPENMTSFGFVFSWQPFDWGQKRHQIAALKSTVTQAAATRGDTNRQVQLDVGTQFRQLAEARLLVTACEANRAAASEKLRDVQNLYAQKAALAADLLQQQASLAQANSQWSQAVAAFWTAKADFHRAMGDE
jgi:outer membrane protein TolC